MSRSYDWWTRYCFRYLKYVSHGACVSLNFTGNYEHCSVSWTTCTFNIYGGIPVKDNFSSVYEKNSEKLKYMRWNIATRFLPHPQSTLPSLYVCVCLQASSPTTSYSSGATRVLMAPLILQRPGSLTQQVGTTLDQSLPHWRTQHYLLKPTSPTPGWIHSHATSTGLPLATWLAQDRVATPRSGRQKQVRCMLHLRFHVKNSFGELVKYVVYSISLVYYSKGSCN